MNEKAARLLGLGQAPERYVHLYRAYRGRLTKSNCYSPKSPLPITPTTSHFISSRRNSDERSWSSPRIIRNMFSRMSLTAPKTSPTTSSPTSARLPAPAEPSRHDFGSPDNHEETLSTRKRRFGLDGMVKGETRGTDLQGIAEETPNTSADDIAAKLSSASNAGSISKRRGYRPLSVRVGGAFDHLSSRESKSDNVEPTHKLAGTDEDTSRDMWRVLELSKKVNWTENLDPHIFNANFIATLTSRRGYLQGLHSDRALY